MEVQVNYNVLENLYGKKLQVKYEPNLVCKIFRTKNLQIELQVQVRYTYSIRYKYKYNCSFEIAPWAVRGDRLRTTRYKKFDGFNKFKILRKTQICSQNSYNFFIHRVIRI